MLKKIFILFLFLFIGGTDVFSQSFFKDPRSGIVVYFTGSATMFPSSWRGGEINGKAKPLKKKEYERSKKLVLQALNKYPVEVLKRNLTKIYIMDYIEFFGLEYGGTNSNSVVYMTNQGEVEGYDDLYVEQTFHHEFSSILMRNYESIYNEYNWTACNSDSAHYGPGGVAALTLDEYGLDFDEKLMEKGFLFGYASSDTENDLNSFAENIFAPSPTFWDMVDKWPRIKCKLELIVEFYQGIHPQFELDYFKRFK